VTRPPTTDCAFRGLRLAANVSSRSLRGVQSLLCEGGFRNANATVCRLSRAGDAAATVETVEAELADLHRRADELPCGTNYSHACFGAIAPEAAKAAHHERSKLMMRVYALEHDEAYVAAKFAVAHDQMRDVGVKRRAVKR